MADIPETSNADPGEGTEIEIEVPAPAGAERSEDPADPETGGLKLKVQLLTAQLEESFARARDTQTKLKDEHERLLRMAAELENFKRRAQKEKEDLGRFGNERLLKDFIPVADNLDRALDHADGHDPKHVAELIVGVQLVQKMLGQAFAKHGVTGFSAVGKPFDPSLHEALMQADSDLPAGTVVSEMAKGYKLHERLLRPAAVVVARVREDSQVSGNEGKGSTQAGDLAPSSESGNKPN